jgi:hypothetical protein
MKKSYFIIIVILVLIIIILIINTFNKPTNNSINVTPITTNTSLQNEASPTEIILYGNMPLTIPAGWNYQETLYASPAMQDEGIPPSIAGYIFYPSTETAGGSHSIVFGTVQFPGCEFMNATLCNNDLTLFTQSNDSATLEVYKNIEAQLVKSSPSPIIN